ncbi:FtsW/RodA/SpoVE family cell cycle protein [Butyrivibrio hungatei]|uniref:FtsW/RodA/SpoVE family cell cycle protein n=1 Tax=Butyrivibrio hungatei TaxID=185008 RepID=UPI00041922C2|nr:FtsW/RodA/SpoVE family cell cycle protein [Butyrivibrio hungatei]
MGIEEYLAEIKNQIRDKTAREFASNELKAHIEDRAEGLQKKGMDHDSAVLQAVKEMGDPVSVGVDLDRIHRPRLEWKFLLYVIYISILSVGVMYLMYFAMDSGNITNGDYVRPFLFGKIFTVLLGLVAMIIVYRLDYTILAGRSCKIAAVFLILMTVSFYFFGWQINGVTWFLCIRGLTFSSRALFLMYLPMFAGILYDYRNKGVDALFKIFLWMIAPVVSARIYGDITLPFAIFMLFSESILFMIALNKNWYRVNNLKVLTGMGIGFAASLALFILRIMNSSDYQKMRLKIWLLHYGLTFGSVDTTDAEYMNYINRCLDNIFLRSRFIGKSESAIEVAQNMSESLADYILATIAATCGKLAVAVIIISLIALAVYVFSISIKQKNILGSIVGCSCGIVIAVQVVSNIMIVFGFLPLAATTLPFFSLGVNDIMAGYILLGLVLSIYRYQDIRVEKEPVTTLLA